MVRKKDEKNHILISSSLINTYHHQHSFIKILPSFIQSRHRFGLFKNVMKGEKWNTSKSILMSLFVWFCSCLIQIIIIIIFLLIYRINYLEICDGDRCYLFIAFVLMFFFLSFLHYLHKPSKVMKSHIVFLRFFH